MNTERIIMETEKIIMDNEKKSYITPEIQIVDTYPANVILTSDTPDNFNTPGMGFDPTK